MTRPRNRSKHTSANSINFTTGNNNNNDNRMSVDENNPFGQGQAKILKQWPIPPEGVRPWEGTANELKLLLECLPRELSDYLQQTYGDRMHEVDEIYLQLGLLPKIIRTTPQGKLRDFVGETPCNHATLHMFASFFSEDGDSRAASMASSKRKGIAKTLHRVSVVTNPTRNPEPVIGVAVRVGRSMEGLLETMAWPSFLKDLAERKESLLLIGKPGVGKTTVLRQMAKVLSQANLEVVVVDKTCEIAGDGDMPHPAIGQSRWMPVGIPGKQHEIMREAVENQSPDVVIVDEISTPQEVHAARTISQRGVMLIATVHGITLPELVHCKERGTLVGGIVSVTLSGREADRRKDKQKQVLKRSQDPVFHAALELHARDKWIFHSSIREATDKYLEKQTCRAQELSPGQLVAVAALPQEGTFGYSQHSIPRLPATSLPSPFK